MKKVKAVPQNKCEILWYPCGSQEAGPDCLKGKCNNEFPYTHHKDVVDGTHPLDRSSKSLGEVWDIVSDEDKAKLKAYWNSEVRDYRCWSIDNSSGFYWCADCNKYLSLAEDLQDTLDDYELDFDFLLEMAYKIIKKAIYNLYCKK